MPSPRFEVPAGVIDGTNRVFTVSMGYTAGTTAVFRNGLLQERSLDDGWDETNPNAGVITMKEAPSASGWADVIQVFFMDQSPAITVSTETVIFKLRGKIQVRPPMKAAMTSSLQLAGKIETPKPLQGKIDSRNYLRGSVSAGRPIKAKICQVSQ